MKIHSGYTNFLQRKIIRPRQMLIHVCAHEKILNYRPIVFEHLATLVMKSPQHA